MKKFWYLENKFNEIHNNKYDYSKSIYVDAKTKIVIICPIHGQFKQTPDSHLSGNGCATCANRPHIDQEQIIERFKNIHGDKYDYSLVKYVKMNDKITIICPKHGKFEQKAWVHYKGHGCFKCAYNINISIKSEKWFSFLNNNNIIKEYLIFSNGRKFLVDGFDPITNTVYEFNGDFWHGNPKLYDQNKTHPVTGEIFGILYNKTIEKEHILEADGYNIISIWESDFNEIINKSINKKI